MYKCACSKMLDSIPNYENHQKLHRHQITARFKCVRYNCTAQFSSYKKCQGHIVRYHQHAPNKNTIQSIKCTILQCPLVRSTKKEISVQLYNHIRRGVFPKCPFREICRVRSTFTKVSSLKQHFFRKHSMSSNTAASASSADTSNNSNSNEILPTDSDSSLNNSNTDADECIIEDCDTVQETSLKLLSSIYLTLEAKYFLSRKSLQVLIDGLTDLDILNTSYISKEFEKRSTVIDRDVLTYNLFHNAHNPISGQLRSAFCRNSYYKKYFNYLQPVCIHLDEVSKFFYVPILGTIKTQFKNISFASAFSASSSKNVTEGVYKDIEDGFVYKTNVFFKDNINAIQVILFQDSFEICNPIGSFRKKHNVNGRLHDDR